MINNATNNKNRLKRLKTAVFIRFRQNEKKRKKNHFFCRAYQIFVYFCIIKQKQITPKN